jgi:hypothetical protein
VEFAAEMRQRLRLRLLGAPRAAQRAAVHQAAARPRLSRGAGPGRRTSSCLAALLNMTSSPFCALQSPLAELKSREVALKVKQLSLGP